MKIELHLAMQECNWAIGSVIDTAFYDRYGMNALEPLATVRERIAKVLKHLDDYEASLTKKEAA